MTDNEKERMIDYIYVQRWKDLSEEELLKLREKLIMKYKLINKESIGIQNSLKKVMDDLDYYIDKKFP